MRKGMVLGIAASLAVAFGSGSASAQYLKDRIGKACAGYFNELPAARVQLCSSIIDDPKRSQNARAWAYANRAGAYYELRNLNLALADADQAVTLWPEYNQSYVIRGTTLGELGRGEAALADLDKAISGVPSYAAFLARGHVFYVMGVYGGGAEAYERALPDFTEAIRRMPGSAAALLGRGNALNALGRYEQSAKDFTAAVLYAPQEPRIWLGRAQANLALSRSEAAVSDLEHARKLGKSGADARGGATWLDVADAFQRHGDYQSALAATDEAVARAPGPRAYNERCWLRVTSGRDLAAARADCDRALEMAPGDAGVLDSRGFLRFRSGDARAAIADLDAALQADPKQAGSLYVRGLAKASLGAAEAAGADIAAAIAIQSDVAAEYARYGLKP